MNTNNIYNNIVKINNLAINHFILVNIVEWWGLLITYPLRFIKVRLLIIKLLTGGH